MLPEPDRFRQGDSPISDVVWGVWWLGVWWFMDGQYRSFLFHAAAMLKQGLSLNHTPTRCAFTSSTP
jgi:hypothetical protein